MEQNTTTNNAQNAPEQNLASHYSPTAQVAFDHFDQLPFITLPELLREGSETTVLNAVNAIYREGPRGLSIQRLMARDITLSRILLRFRQALESVELERFTKGGGDLKRIELIERLVAGQHGRLITAIEQFARLERGGIPQIRVTANTVNAQLNVGTQP
jgi:hypothetical protein